MSNAAPHHFHAVIWIDHREARIFRFNAADANKGTLHPHHTVNSDHQLHHKAGVIGSGHASENHPYLSAVAKALADAGAILVTGPANEKTELVKYLKLHSPAVAERVVGVEPLDRPTDGELVAHARNYFRHADHMTPQRPAR